MATNYNFNDSLSHNYGLSGSVGLSIPVSQGYSNSGQSSGSVNSAQSYNNSFNEAYSSSSSGTDAATARAWSAMMADLAWERDMEAFNMQMDYNSREAQKQRDWQAEMANTIYTRSVKNMREAGINPILAFRMGLSGANVGTGAQASLGGSPSAPLAQNFMDSWSASNSFSHGSGEGSSFGSGSSWGSGWSNSEEGIITALQGLAGMADAAIDGINAGNTLDWLNNTYDENPIKKWGEGVGKQIKDSVGKGINKFLDKVQDKATDYVENKNKEKGANGGGHSF